MYKYLSKYDDELKVIDNQKDRLIIINIFINKGDYKKELELIILKDTLVNNFSTEKEVKKVTKRFKV